MLTRSYKRLHQDLRPVQITTGINDFAEGSALVEFGRTKVLCTANFEKNVPPWLQNQQKGWVTAEYSMLPSSTPSRSRRERDKVGGRTLEIQRLISRSLRSVVDLKKLPEKTLIIDCDVLCADGGTRTASITGAYVALALALEKHKLKNALIHQVAAISVGLVQGELVVDLDYAEDSTSDVDMNIVMLENGEFVEVQGTGENKTFHAQDLLKMVELAQLSIRYLHKVQNEALAGKLIVGA